MQFSKGEVGEVLFPFTLQIESNCWQLQCRKCPIRDELAVCVLDFMSHITEQLSKEDPKIKTFFLSYPKAFVYPAKFRPKLYWQLFVHQDWCRQVVLLNLNCIARVAFWLLLSCYNISFLSMFCFSFWDVFKETCYVFLKWMLELGKN